MSDFGLVLYCDGGNYRKNNAPGGGGVHGYTYNTEAIDKKNKLKKIVPTNLGYVADSAKVHECDPDFGRSEYIANLAGDKPYHVNIVSYLDGFKSADKAITNNVAEIMGMTMAFNIMLERKPTVSKIICDSQYVVLAVNGRLEQWEKQGWKKSDGTLLANIEYFKELLDLIKKAKAENLFYSVEWIKGHAGHLGNEQADTMASISACSSNTIVSGFSELLEDNHLNLSANREHVSKNGYHLFISSPIDYWKKEVEVHPFLQNTKLYWNPAFDKDDGVYYTGYPGYQAGKDKDQVDDLLGKKISDAGLSVVKLNKVDDVIKSIKKIQQNWLLNTLGTDDVVVIGQADNIFSTHCNHLILNYGNHHISSFNPLKPDLYTSDNMHLTTVLYPVYLGQRSLEKLNRLEDLLDEFNEGKFKGQCSDVTSYIYEDNFKTNKKTGEQTLVGKQLKPTVVVGCATITVPIKFEVDGKIIEKQFPLSLGIDFIKRNSLKHLETFEPVVNAVTRQYSGNVYEYAVIITLNNGETGIWAPTDSNRIVVR